MLGVHGTDPSRGVNAIIEQAVGREDRMAKARVFTSFDFDHDENLRNLLVGQAKLPDSPFELADWSVKEPMTWGLEGKGTQANSPSRSSTGRLW